MKNPLMEDDEKTVVLAEEDHVSRATFSELKTFEFYGSDQWFDRLCESLFHVQERKSSISAELYFGLVHFISCFYCLAVIPQQLSQAGYEKRNVFVATAACCGVGSIICGLFANLPFVVAPPTVTSIFLSVYLQSNEGDITNNVSVGSFGVIISGALLMLMGWRPLGDLVGRLIPSSIQAGTAIGIGLLTALAGAVEIDLVVSGQYNQLLQMGSVSPEVLVSIGGIIAICIAAHFHIKGAFCIAIVSCSIAYAIYSNEWPSGIAAIPVCQYFDFQELNNHLVPVLVLDLLFLDILYLNGLIASLSHLANLSRAKDGTTPRSRWIFILCGLMTIVSGLLTGAPVLISPESAAAIKDGAKTGLSTLVCGVLFLVAIIFSPLFDAIPNAGTSPILIMIGTLLFQNVVRIDWKSVKDATPAFMVLFFIPFTYSVIQGVLLGYAVYLIVGFFTGDLYSNLLIFIHIYAPLVLKELLPTDPRSDPTPSPPSYQTLADAGPLPMDGQSGTPRSRGASSSGTADVHQDALHASSTASQGDLVEELPTFLLTTDPRSRNESRGRRDSSSSDGQHGMYSMVTEDLYKLGTGGADHVGREREGWRSGSVGAAALGALPEADEDRDSSSLLEGGRLEQRKSWSYGNQPDSNT